MTLKELAIGERATVVGFNPSGKAYRRKLLSMGLTPGAELSLVRVAPLGDPLEILIRGYSLSLRKDEADALSVDKLP
ncbi:ferrous iron transport protein A [Methylicorpusculum oleiharenae]|jgi:ferrous iron transport protein A|uniref:FeoA family protein n=1 Tax=Methylicorpusculum oleiharenae TaxID=1338687 RepID=UPI00135BF40D|nr:FeoA family protein [Methylicorpusculum oleiharenae]MCD2453684.1 ferrous iron transport protein A [Methylicorpusculum oleiharenae]